MMDGRSRIATIRVGNDVEDSTPSIKFNLEDHLGTSSVMLDSGGNLINREEYYPFGETSFGAFAKKRYRYVGKEKDNESGLYYYGARYYAGWMCRFVSVDPLAANYAHLNPYNYAGNKPIGDLDIDGLQGTGEQQSGDGSPMTQVPATDGVPTFELKAAEIVRSKTEGQGDSASPSVASTAPVLAADQTARPGAIRQPHSPPRLPDAAPQAGFLGLKPVGAQSQQTIGPADDSYAHKLMSDQHRLTNYLNKQKEGRRQLDPTAMAGAEGLITAAQHPVDVALVFVPELLLMRVQKVAEAYRLANGIVRSSEVTVFHTVRSSEQASSMLRGVDATRLSTGSRFGAGVYTSEQVGTTLLELSAHNATGSHTIRYALDLNKAKVLDLTEFSTAAEWGYAGGGISTATQSIGAKAFDAGYSVVKFPSVRGPGSNYAVIGNFEELLKAHMIFPVP